MPDPESRPSAAVTSPSVEVRSATAEEMPAVIAQASRQLGLSTVSFGGM